MKDYKDLQKDLAVEEGESWLRAYPDSPVDSEGNPISDQTTEELGVEVIAGAGHEKKINRIDSLIERYGGDEKDWVKLSTPPREGIEIHGFKNLETNHLSLNQEPIDVERRRQEMIGNNVNSDSDQDDKNERFLDTDDQTDDSALNENSDATITEVEHDPSEQNIREEFVENNFTLDEVEADDQNVTESSSDSADQSVTETFAENNFTEALIDQPVESSTEDIPTSEFRENLDDITDKVSNSDDDPDHYTLDYRPGL